jgi:hypothetical protein
MKLYTEEQVRNAIELAQKCEHDCGGVYFKYDNPDEVLEELTPIELPSDEEIEDTSLSEEQEKGFRDGAQWLKDKIFPF